MRQVERLLSVSSSDSIEPEKRAFDRSLHLYLSIQQAGIGKREMPPSIPRMPGKGSEWLAGIGKHVWRRHWAEAWYRKVGVFSAVEWCWPIAAVEASLRSRKLLVTIQTQ